MCVNCHAVAVTQGYCVEHAPVPFAKAKVRWRNQRPANWSALRRRVIRLAGGRCQKCGEPGNQVDHKVPVAEGGSWDLDNLQLLCPQCHKTKSEEDAARGREAARRRRLRR